MALSSGSSYENFLNEKTKPNTTSPALLSGRAQASTLSALLPVQAGLAILTVGDAPTCPHKGFKGIVFTGPGHGPIALHKVQSEQESDISLCCTEVCEEW